MSKKLTKKQIEQLSQFTADELLVLVHDLAENYGEINQYLAVNYLMSSEEKLKSAENEYKRQFRKKGNYEYWKSHTFFLDLENKIVTPLDKLSLDLPSETLKITEKMIGEIDDLFEKYDTSSGSWQDYLYGLLNVWIKALGAAYKKDNQMDFVGHYLGIKSNCDYFNPDLLQQNKAFIPREAIQKIRDALKDQDEQQVLEISFVLKDHEYLVQAYETNRFLNDQFACFKYAQLLLDEFKTEEAVLVLKELKSAALPYEIQFKVENLLIDALYENGDRDEALELCKEYFSRNLNSDYCRKFIKYNSDHNAVNTEYFYQRANQSGAISYLRFVAEMENWSVFELFLIEKIIEGDEEWDESIFEFLQVATIRKWSTALAQQGFPLSAVLLRRKLVEDNLIQARSANYKYAVSDLKKSLDYMEHLSAEHQQLIPSTLEYITALHEKHQRKYAFWNACIGLIPEQFTQYNPYRMNSGF